MSHVQVGLTETEYDDLWSATVHRHTAEEHELRQRHAEEMLALVERNPNRRKDGINMQRRHWQMVVRVAREQAQFARLREAQYPNMRTDG